MNLQSQIEAALSAGTIRTSPRGTVNVARPLQSLRTITRQCDHCCTLFEPVMTARYCSDECLFTAHPELVADRTETMTDEQRLEARWEATLPARQREYQFRLLKSNGQTIARRLYAGWQGGSLLILGPSEGGKTFLAFRCARLAFMRGKTVRHDTAEGIRAKWLDERKSLERCKRADVLLIDDLGMENTTDGWTSAAYELIKAREDDGLCTIITANRSRSYFGEKYSTALANRLWRMEVINL